MGYFQVLGLIRRGGWVKQINNRNFRIIGQNKRKMLCPINSVKLLIINNLCYVILKPYKNEVFFSIKARFIYFSKIKI